MATEIALIAEARSWLADCEWREADPDDLMDEDLYPDTAIRAAVGRHYEGGWHQFVVAST